MGKHEGLEFDSRPFDKLPQKKDNQFHVYQVLPGT